MAKRGSGNYLLRLSITLMVVGYGSVLLNFTEVQFTVLSWADNMQPWIGLILGTIGLAILLVPLLLARRGGSVAPAQPFQQQPFPQQQPFQQQPFPQQQPFQQQPFPQQQPFQQQQNFGYAQPPYGGPPAQQGFAQQYGQPQQAQFPPQQPQSPQQGYGPQQ